VFCCPLFPLFYCNNYPSWPMYTRLGEQVPGLVTLFWNKLWWVLTKFSWPLMPSLGQQLWYSHTVQTIMHMCISISYVVMFIKVCHSSYRRDKIFYICIPNRFHIPDGCMSVS
jgi:hypothetical protein